ncbi:MAG: hypothetical protein R2874_03485 [Desulfobacterales bacterium]
MYRHSIISTLIVIFIVLTSGIPASAQAQESASRTSSSKSAVFPRPLISSTNRRQQTTAS